MRNKQSEARIVVYNTSDRDVKELQSQNGGMVSPTSRLPFLKHFSQLSPYFPTNADALSALVRKTSRNAIAIFDRVVKKE